MNLSMTPNEYYDYIQNIDAQKIKEIFEMIENGEYQKRIIKEYNSKYSFFNRIRNTYPETDLVNLCKKSLSNSIVVSAESKELLRKPLLHDLSVEGEKMFEEYNKKYRVEIWKRAKKYPEQMVKKFVNQYFEEMERNYLEWKNKNDTFYRTNHLLVTETAIEIGRDLFVSLESLGLKSVIDKIDQAALAAAILQEVAIRYKEKYSDNMNVLLSHEWKVNPSSPWDAQYIRNGYYQIGQTYISIALGVKDDDRIIFEIE